MTDGGHQLSPGYNFAGRYYVSRCIGVGGMGSVYEVSHAETRGRCALKVMLPRIVHREDMRKRFLQEAQVTAQINSDHIVRVFDAGVDDVTGMPFIVMELLEGEDLDALLQRNTRLDPALTVRLLRQAALALDKTHAAGVVHRDLKPHNLYITRRDDGSPCLKILDFGIAKLIDASGGDQRTRSAGTPMYMPPEQIRGEGDIGQAADVYALAHIAYTMLTGVPYWEQEAHDLGLGPFIERIFAGPSEAPSTRAARAAVVLPPSFDAWFARAAAPVREQRYADASVAIRDLAAALGVTDLAAGASSPSGVLTPPPRPNPSPVGVPMTQAGTAASVVPVGPATPFTPAGLGSGPLPSAHTTAGAVSAPQPPRKASSKGLWLAVAAIAVIGGVGVGSVLTYRFVKKERRVQTETTDEETDADNRKKKSKKKKSKQDPDEKEPCVYERCKDYDVEAGRALEPLDHMDAVTELALAMEPKAKLQMISVGELIRGVPPSDAIPTVSYIFRYPQGESGKFSGVNIILNGDQLLGRHLQDVGMPEAPVPTCKAQDALHAAFADGLDAAARTTMTYHFALGTKNPMWTVMTSGTASLRYVDGMTCKASATLDLLAMKGMRALVTGGGGFIGSHLVDTLLDAGASVRVLDNFETGKRENLAKVADAIELMVGDIRDADCCRKACEGMDVLFHQAALGSVPRSVAEPAVSVAVNVGGTANMFAAARDAGIERVVYASSSSVYGDSDRLPKREGEEGQPLSPYALSKRMCEDLAEIFARCYEMRFVGLRYFNVYGPRQDPEGPYAAVIPRFFAACRAGERPIIFGDGKQSRDFTFVADVARANILAAAAEVEGASAMNVGTGSAVTITELARAIVRVSGADVEPDCRDPRPGDVLHSRADPARARKTIGFSARLKLEEGLTRTYVASMGLKLSLRPRL